MFFFLDSEIRQLAYNLFPGGNKPIGVLVDLFSITYEIRKNMEKRSREFGLSYGQYIALCVLSAQRNEMSSPSALAEKMGVSRAAISSMVISLEQEGFINKYDDPNDKRGVFVSLNDKGRSKIKQMDPFFVGLASRLMSDFSESEICQFQTYLSRVRSAFEDVKGSRLTDSREEREKWCED
ncbi:Transcriptional repressor MprA [Paenibacillus polymyxa E681]|uniref:MarR family winged helix-turn-helix transcriptional regulator n=1 Tax=Paenibacillus polymyxa TaxID=1406 RepID=UPI0001E31067|nr:MarR family transcriptional regulator [Paenibacillus polymyxa]ADM68216.1 transcriptional regulator [Paenibacillus polymyxa E681]QNV55212.1 Transcriptional repressor MprA [Paenibacillus polymyxa E681]QNV60048.1 Transcriptional repressor MprA [Paenibacillus polymyxa E681]